MRSLFARCPILATLAVAAVACGGGGSTPTVPPSTATLTLTADPSSVTGRLCTRCGDLAGEREAVTTLTVHEGSGVGVDLVAIDIQLRLDSEEVLAGGSFEAGGIASFAGTARLTASGQLVLPNIGVHYPGARSGLAGTLTYGVRGRDDNGHEVSNFIRLRVVT